MAWRLWEAAGRFTSLLTHEAIFSHMVIVDYSNVTPEALSAHLRSLLQRQVGLRPRRIRGGGRPNDEVVRAMLTQHLHAGNIRRVARGVFASVPKQPMPTNGRSIASWRRPVCAEVA